ncbi:MAG: cellulase [Alphaproteobacteria bacterium CG11_big_fil_rev_8_21_14_0_20_39_49]|nr:MAG: cellulase [Alphaproteobacteria bacterium CG11_big_fil_rev_8_21_14_0_20_39_49]
MNKKISIILYSAFLSAISANAYSNTSENKITYHEKDFTNSVSLQGINKITARVSSFEVQKDNKMNFGNLEVQLIKCWKAPPEEEPENKALLRIWEQIPGEDKKEIFSGWMFSSSPALSALEHPVYDIVVKGCMDKENEADTSDTDTKPTS